VAKENRLKNLFYFKMSDNALLYALKKTSESKIKALTTYLDKQYF